MAVKGSTPICEDTAAHQQCVSARLSAGTKPTAVKKPFAFGFKRTGSAGAGRSGVSTESIWWDNNAGPDTPACLQNPPCWRMRAVICLDRDQPCRRLLENNERVQTQYKQARRTKQVSTGRQAEETSFHGANINFNHRKSIKDMGTASWQATRKDGRWGSQGPEDDSLSQTRHKRHAKKLSESLPNLTWKYQFSWGLRRSQHLGKTT